MPISLLEATQQDDGSIQLTMLVENTSEEPVMVYSLGLSSVWADGYGISGGSAGDYYAMPGTKTVLTISLSNLVE